MPLVARASRWATVGVAAIAVILLVRVSQQSDDRFLPKAVASDRARRAAHGVVDSGTTWNLTADELCAPGASWSSDGYPTRPRPGPARVPVWSTCRQACYELDYLITPELGGAPTVQNLWPQRYASRDLERPSEGSAGTAAPETRL